MYKQAILKDSDVIMLCETHLSPHDLDTDYKMDTFADVVHHDERTANESQSFHGLAAYVKDHICLRKYTNNEMKVLKCFTCAYTK